MKSLTVDNFLLNNKVINTNSIGKLFWNNDDNVIIEELRKCKNENVTLILSQLLPDELPRSISIQEYNYFISKYLFIPPIITDLKEDLTNFNTGNEIGIILDSNTVLSKSEKNILNLLKRVLKTKYINILITEIDSIKEQDIYPVIINFNQILLITRNPHFELHCKIICKRLNKNCETLKKPSGSINRYLALGIEYNFFLLLNKKKSLRDLIYNLISKSNKSHKINSFIDSVEKIKDRDNSLNILNQNESYKYFTKDYYGVLNNVKRIELIDENFNYLNTFYTRLSLLDTNDNIETSKLSNKEFAKYKEFKKRKYLEDFISAQKDKNWKEEFQKCLLTNNNFLKQILCFEKETSKDHVFESKIIEYQEYALSLVKILSEDENVIIQKTLKEYEIFIKKSNIYKRYQKLLFFVYESYKNEDGQLVLNSIYQKFSNLNEDRILDCIVPRLYKVCSYIFDIRNMLHSISHFSNYYSDKSNLINILINTNIEKNNICLNSLTYSKSYQTEKNDIIDIILTNISTFDQSLLTNNKYFFYLPILFKKNITKNLIPQSTDNFSKVVYCFTFWVNGLNDLAESIFKEIKFTDDFDFSVKIRYYVLNIIFLNRSHRDSLFLPESFTKELKSNNFYSNCNSSPIRLMESLLSCIILYNLNDYDHSMKLFKNFLNNVNFKCETLLERLHNFLPKDKIKI